MYSKLQDGSFMICGYVPKDAELRAVGEKKSSLCKWSVKVGERKKGDDTEAVWTSCQAWHSAARYAAAIKKGDTVLCVGKIEKYTGNNGKEYKNLVCEFVSIMKKPQAESVVLPSEGEDSLELSEYEDILSDGEPPF